MRCHHHFKWMRHKKKCAELNLKVDNKYTSNAIHALRKIKSKVIKLLDKNKYLVFLFALIWSVHLVVWQNEKRYVIVTIFAWKLYDFPNKVKETYKIDDVKPAEKSVLHSTHIHMQKTVWRLSLKMLDYFPKIKLFAIYTL